MGKGESVGEIYVKCTMNEQKVKRKQLLRSPFVSDSLTLSHLNKEQTFKKKKTNRDTDT